MFESIIAGITAWIFVLSHLCWFAGIILTALEVIDTRSIEDTWAIVIALSLTGYGIYFVIQSNSELQFDQTKEFVIEALQFRRSAQHRLELIDLIHLRQKNKNLRKKENDPEALQRARLQNILSKEKEFEVHIKLLRQGNIVDITDDWRERAKEIPANVLFQQTQEARIDPQRKRLIITTNFPELDADQLKDEMVILRFNRQVYDFLQFLNTETWLKPYMQFYESYFLICRATQINLEGHKIFYPFIKVGMLISDLQKLEGTYFNPRKLSEIAAVAFKSGDPV